MKSDFFFAGKKFRQMERCSEVRTAEVKRKQTFTIFFRHLQTQIFFRIFMLLKNFVKLKGVSHCFSKNVNKLSRIFRDF